MSGIQEVVRAELKDAGFRVLSRIREQRAVGDDPTAGARSDVSGLHDAMMAIVLPLKRRFVQAVAELADLQAEVGELRTKLAEVEQQRPSVRFMGLYDPRQDYRVGDLVTASGSLFACMVDDPQSPPQHSVDSNEWLLAARRGRDASGRNR